MSNSSILLDIKNLKTYFRSDKGPIRAVDGVSLTINKGSTVAIVGESGCGKSVTALSLARLIPTPPGYFEDGEILFNGEDVLKMSNSEIASLRGGKIAYVFQEPATALNPVFRTGRQIMEAVKLHQPDSDPKEEAIRLMRLVGLPNPEERLNAYPHEMSGGMQQRVMIAIALACKPDLLVADEPTTALDVTIQAQILELLSELQKKLGMAVMIITHNLGLVADIAENVNVMYSGRIVESGKVVEVLKHPKHPYTKALLGAVPKLNGSKNVAGIPGSVPNPSDLPEGCKFAPRCSKAKDKCLESEPQIDNTKSHTVRCFYPGRR